MSITKFLQVSLKDDVRERVVLIAQYETRSISNAIASLICEALRARDQKEKEEKEAKIEKMRVQHNRL